MQQTVEDELHIIHCTEEEVRKVCMQLMEDAHKWMRDVDMEESIREAIHSRLISRAIGEDANL